METYSTYESLRQHFEALARAGYFKIVMKDVSRTKRLLHDFYRSVVWFLVILYNIQHVISVFQARGDTGKLADTLFILLTTLGCLGKQAAFNLRSRRIERLLSIVNGPLFAATTPHDIEVLKQNALNMSRILKLYQVSVITCGTTMAIFPFFNRAQGKQVQFTGYVPIDTKSPTIFTIILLYMTFSVTFQGYANVSQDCTIVAFYAVARVQIQMLRYNLEHLADGSNQDNNMLNEDKSGVLQRRLGKCVEHYRQIAWFCKEIESIFFEALFFQFLIMAWVICMTVYKIVGLNLLSVEFVSMLAYLMCILAQLFLYCYYGTQFKNESGYINQSVYFSNWMSLSPAFRRQLLVIMEYCLPPITPSIAYVVPMTLETFISVLRSSYTLFTVLDRQ
ncbi:odorant receptor Or1 [Amyelois transitella]|uniref:odorant receptor Or1 n=1 Tax=Amyelois transitella TaxID=680683 RepID=UPI0029901A3B|nr:odorant receptor Or1 [Amyelois transitella]